MMPTVADAVFDLNVIGPEPIEAIRRAGGTILHVFQVPLVRVSLPVRSVSSLANDGHVRFAREVEAGRAPDFDGVIGLPTPLSAADREFLESLGVTNIETPLHGHAIRATIPDLAVPSIRIHPGVYAVEMNNFACVD
ncbi:MAG: hypothetical protein ABIS67_01785 [Candidatus Eisenbacteria bacterium]